MSETSNPPAYYMAGDTECREVLENLLGESYIEHCRANAIEYLWRAPRKGGAEDYKKALWNVMECVRVAGNA